MTPSKPIDDSFTDWESDTFGYGYGTGEPFTLNELKRFLTLFPIDGHFNYREFEAALGGAVTWLLINALCGVNILEYGASPRTAWLNRTGRRLKQFVEQNSLERLVELTAKSEDYIYCSPNTCNCGPKGYERGRVCINPFWTEKRLITDPDLSSGY